MNGPEATYHDWKRRTTEEAIEYYASILVSIGRCRQFDDDRIRHDIKRAFITALRDDCYQQFSVPDAEETADTLMYAGFFCLVFTELQLDRADQVQQETWYSTLTRAMEAALSRTKGGWC